MNNNNAIIFQAIDVILDKREQQLEYNKIDKAIITEIVNPVSGVYKINFNGNVIQATANSIYDIYSIGDSVLISYVNNHLTNGTIQILKKLENGDNNNIVSYVPFGPDWFPTFYTMDTNQQIIQIEDNINIFNNYVNNCNYIRVSADFKPFLLKPSVEYKFKYGIQIIFTLEDDSEIEYFLDSEQFQGNIYANSKKKQEIILNIPNNIKALSQVNCYVINPEDEIGCIDIDKGEKISVSNYNIVFLKQVKQENSLYYLNVRAPRGVYFTPEINEDLTLEASLVCGSSQSAVSEDNLTFSWYKQNGYDWVLLPEQTSSILTVTSTDVQINKIFKLMVQLNNGTILEKEIELFNMKENLELELQLQDTKLIINNSNFSGFWEVEYTDSKEAITTERINSLDISNYIGYDWAKFYCYNLMDLEGNLYDVTLTHTLTAATLDKDLQVLFSGDYKYTYDEQGGIAFAESEIYKLLSYKTIWAEGTINRIRATQWSINGEILGGQPITPADSMLQNVWIDENDQVHYQIKNIYNDNYINNTIKLTITLINNAQYSFEKQIQFNKIGSTSTTGDLWSCVVRPVELSNDLSPSQKFYSLYGNNSIQLKAFVYRNGHLITDNVQYHWELNGGIGTDYNASLSNSTLTVVNRGSSINNIPYVKVRAIVNNNMYLYAYYGINFSSEQLSENFYSNLPKEIEYSNGYLSSELMGKYDNENINFEVIQKEIPVTLTEDNKIEINNTYLGAAIPFFLTRVILPDDVVLFWPIFVNIKTPVANSLPGWDGNQLQINEEEIIEAPQVGSGSVTLVEKATGETAEVFNGIIMGTENKKGDKAYGIYGYQDGEQTFSLRENGSAAFGKEGQLKIDDKGILYVGGWTLEKKEMYSSDKSTRLHSQDGIFTEALSIVEEQDNKQVVMGKVGKIKGFDGENVTTTVGLNTREIVTKPEDDDEEEVITNYSIVLESGQHIRLSVPEGGHIYLQCAPENQHGIYARFA